MDIDMALGITDGSKILIPLYHGTSGLFLPSIREFGFGTKDPNVDLKSYELLSELLEIMKRNSWYYDEYLATQEFLFQYMVDQRVTAGGFNFRHGTTYLSPAEVIAVQYALTNPYGSELLSNAITLLEGLTKHDKPLAQEILQRYPNVASLRANRDRYPVLIEATQIPITSLQSEKGGDASETISLIEEILNENDQTMFQILCQQFNFELVVALPENSLRYYEIERHESNKYTLKTITA